MALGEVADQGADDRYQEFGRCGVEMQVVDKEFQADIVDQQADGDHQQVTAHLRAVLHRRAFEDDVVVQPVTGG